MAVLFDPLACPNPLAERRYAYAIAAVRDGDFAEACEVFEQALELAPDWPPALFALAEARQSLGDREGAASAYRACLAADATDRHGAAPRLALLEGGPAGALPAAYVARLFDDYAPRFDRHLRDELAYRGPERIDEAIEAAAPGRRFALALDLGCGTGLAAPLLRRRAERLVGVDLSAGMVEKAEATGLYESAHVGEVVGFLSEFDAQGADLVVAADMLVYLGDLAPLFSAVSRAFEPEGLFVFSVESQDGDGFRLQSTMRFTHSRAYVEAALTTAGLHLVDVQTRSTRREADEDVPGLIFVATRAL